MIRIAFCITELDPGGAERALVELVTRLDRNRFQAQVYSLAGSGGLQNRLHEEGIPAIALQARSRFDVGVIGRLWRELRRFRPHILQTWLFHANLAGRIAGRLAGVLHIVSGIRVAERRTRWPLRLDRCTSGWVARHVCVSRAVAEFSRDVARLPADKLLVIPNGVDLQRFTHALPADLTQIGVPLGAPVLLTVGRLDPQKGLVDLLTAIPRLRKRFPDVHWVLAGDGPLRQELQRQVREMGQGGRVHFAGWRGDIPQLLAAARGLVLPSLWEGMPNVVLEAMAAGLPVVATRVEGTAELVVPGETGWLTPVGEPAALAQGMAELLVDPVRAGRFGAAGRERVAREFTWEAMVERYAELYLGLSGMDDVETPPARAVDR